MTFLVRAQQVIYHLAKLGGQRHSDSGDMFLA